jgi:predicted phosphodiesterase
MGDHRGQLIALEENQNIPFDIKRVFYIYGTLDGVKRGEHSHYKTRQLLIAVSGSCEVTLDNGSTKQTFSLNKPNEGLLQDALIWGTMHNFSENCVLMVLADTHYDESDYIKDYKKFLKAVHDS